MSNFGSVDWFYEVSAGRVPKTKGAFFIGINPNMTVGSSQTIWDQGGSYVYLTADTTLYASSSSASDTDVDIIVTGLDETYTEITRTVNLNGQSQVALSGDMFRVFTAIVAETSNNTPLGDVYIAEADTLTGGVPDTASKIKSKIPLSVDMNNAVIDSGTEFASSNSTHNGFFTVPAGYRAFIRQGALAAGKNDDIITGGRIRFYDEVGASYGPWLDRNPSPIYQGFNNLDFILPIQLPERAELEFRAVPSATGARASIQFFYALEEL